MFWTVATLVGIGIVAGMAGGLVTSLLMRPRFSRRGRQSSTCNVAGWEPPPPRRHHIRA